MQRAILLVLLRLLLRLLLVRLPGQGLRLRLLVPLLPHMLRWQLRCGRGACLQMPPLLRGRCKGQLRLLLLRPLRQAECPKCKGNC